MKNSIFEKIIRREIPASIVYEDDDTLAFLDANPVNLGHTLVVPKQPARNLFDTDHVSLSAVMQTTQKVASAIRRALDADGINVHINNEPAAGQIIFYFHVHIIPRFSNDGYENWHGKQHYRDDETIKIAEKIRHALV